MVNNSVQLLRPPLPAAEVVGHDEGPVGDGGHLHLPAPEAGLP